MRGFRIDGEDLVADADADEREVFASVIADVAELLGAGRLEQRTEDPDTEPVGFRLRLDPIPAPDDPAVHRLLPDASRDDAELTAEFRRLTEDDLRQEKIERLAALYRLFTADGPIRVRRSEAHRLAATLTDVRLVLGERLGIVDDESGEELEDELVAGDGEPARQYLGSIYLALGWWQETLMACLLAGLP